ncbi:DnaJ domain-containing protein [Natrinema sp. 1APR25-10V2]|uniref:J domain-containing protein n=1 Tax=Natrinema sp. 1APR25-10V2 TaxID=2951081 RepID=UPI0028762D22|nr:DnaJ domain-containing protein [Natrinema sp. 1APR25-10V2]MDS0477429.1 DnaJ domain-containing protein [Natrinema sp. 1APR25-10V2]
MGETYYDVLGVERDATQDDIESAYRDRVLETHPDHSDAPDAAEQFKRVTTARSVLTDGAERARYDRLGHEAYVGLAQEWTADGDSSGEDDADASSSTPSRGTGETNSTGSETTGTETTDRTRERARQARDRSTDSSDPGPSHHARQRARRQHRRKQRRAAGEWPFGDERVAGGTSSSQPTGGAGETDHSIGESGDGFQYSVHDWDGDVDLEWEGTPIDRTTAITVAAIVFCYPLFVGASLTPLFSVPVNAIVAACTLVLVGYLLTMPRIAIAVFGAWSVLFPVAIVGFSLAEPASLSGVLALAFAWVPLGYAVALWWTLRP